MWRCLFHVNACSSIMSSANAIPVILLAVVLGGCRATVLPGNCSLSAPAPGELVGVCGFVNPEDLEPVQGASLVLTAAFHRGGKLQAFELTDQGVPAPIDLWPSAMPQLGGASSYGEPGCQGPPTPDDFHPHGIGVKQIGEGLHFVAVVDHGTRASIDRNVAQLFLLRGRWPAPAVEWVGCVTYPAAMLANDIVVISPGEFYATNFSPGPGLGPQIKSLFGIDTGDVVHWSAANGWRHIAGTASPTPNGIALSVDGSVVIFADNGRKRVAFFQRKGLKDPVTLQYVGVSGRPDNVNVSVDGCVLTVTTNLTGAFPYNCDFNQSRCAVGWDVWEIDLENRSSRRLLRHDGSIVGSATSALAVGNAIYVGNQLDDRLGMCRAPRVPLASSSEATASVRGSN